MSLHLRHSICDKIQKELQHNPTNENVLKLKLKIKVSNLYSAFPQNFHRIKGALQ